MIILVEEMIKNRTFIDMAKNIAKFVKLLSLLILFSFKVIGKSFGKRREMTGALTHLI